MKKMILPSILSVTILAGSMIIGASMASCDKKEITKQTQSPSQEISGVKKPKKGGDVPKLIPAYGSVALWGSSCGPITCAIPTFTGYYKYNCIKITKDASTLAVYPATMRYSIYIRTNQVSGNLYNIKKVRDFTCSQNAPLFADSVLENSKWHYVLITDPITLPPGINDVIDITTPQSLIPFYTGNEKGGTCF